MSSLLTRELMIELLGFLGPEGITESLLIVASLVASFVCLLKFKITKFPTLTDKLEG